MNTKKIIFIILTIFSTALLFNSCVEENFDRPPSNCDDFNFKGNITVDSLKNLFINFEDTSSMDTLKITDSLLLEGYITSSDQYGNIYKELMIQDSTGGISLQVDAVDMFLKYPIGQKVVFLLKGLYVGRTYYGVIKLGGRYLDQGTWEFGRIVGDSVLNQYVARSCDNNQVTPKTVKLSEINDDVLYQLIKIDTVQFKTSEMNSTWADGINFVTVNHNIIDNNGHTLIVRTSGYASFAKDSLPKGSGYIIGIIGKYNSDYQLQVRSINDVNMTGERFAE